MKVTRIFRTLRRPGLRRLRFVVCRACGQKRPLKTRLRFRGLCGACAIS
ncbi:hypothetical protein HY251_18855 [bacterium]|nr:hypothetical protein [bacterium]